MVFNALQINSHVFSEECKWKKNPFGRRKVASAECELSIGHITITLAIQWRRLGAAYNVWRPQGPSYSMNVVVHIGKQRLYKPRDCHQILTSSRTVQQRQNGDLRFCLPCEKCEWWGRRERAPVNFLKESFADEETCRDRYRLEHAGRWLDQRLAILADQHVVVTNSTISFQVFFASWSTSSNLVSAAQFGTALAAEIGSRLALRLMIDEHGNRRPAQLLRFLKSSNCACVKISPSAWGILGNEVLFRLTPNTQKGSLSRNSAEVLRCNDRNYSFTRFPWVLIFSNFRHMVVPFA